MAGTAATVRSGKELKALSSERTALTPRATSENRAEGGLPGWGGDIGGGSAAVRKDRRPGRSVLIPRGPAHLARREEGAKGRRAEPTNS